MKPVYSIVLTILLYSCASVEKNVEAVDVISWESAWKDDASFLESIDVIPLETDSDVLVKTPSLFQYIKDIDAFLLLDSRPVAFLFEGDGRHRSNSSACIGEGPQEYSMVVDAEYNPYSRSIELYNPDKKGSIYRYDLQFNWKQTIKLNHEKGFTGHIICLLKENLYVLEPVRWNEDDLFVKLYDFKNGEAVVTDVPYDKSGYIAGLNMMRKNFSVTDSCIYYTPDYMDYGFYQYDVAEENFAKIYRLDFGKKNISKKDLDDLVMQEKADYLLSSHYPLPIIRLINDSFVYVHFICDRKPYHLIYNRKTRKTFGLTPKSPLKMYRCFDLVDNALYTILYPYELDEYLDETNRKYLSEEALKRLEDVKEEDNPVVIKYCLREFE